jgi:phage shock protein PspC (stress-responsive transcriptional regulator)
MTATRLYRSARDRVIAGVCGGLGHSMGIDPTIVRLFFVLGVGPSLNVLVYPLRRSAIR